MSAKQHKAFLILLGNKIKANREALGITQSELARRCDKDRQNINRIEKGYVNISVGYLKLIAESLNLSIKDFFED